MKRTILVTSAGGDVACAIMRCIVDCEGDYKIIGCDINKYTQGLLYADEYLVSPRYSCLNEYVDFIKNTCLELSVDIFLPTSESEILIASQMRDFFLDHGIKMCFVNDQLIEIGTSKLKTAELCKRIGISAPETMQLDDAKNALQHWNEYPAIIKKIRGCGADGLRRVCSVDDALLFIDEADNLNEWIIQKEIGTLDNEYTMGVFSDGSSVSQITFRRKLGNGSMSVYVETVEDPQFDHIAKEIAEATNLVGSINVQMRYEDNNYHVFEINPRLSSSCRFRDLNGGYRL